RADGYGAHLRAAAARLDQRLVLGKPGLGEVPRTLSVRCLVVRADRRPPSLLGHPNGGPVAQWRHDGRWWRRLVVAAARRGRRRRPVVDPGPGATAAPLA